MPITKNTPIGTIIKDFVESDDPKFAGKSKEERINMAKGAYYGMQKESIEELIAQISEKDDAAEVSIQEILSIKIAEKLEIKKQEIMEGAFGSSVLGKSKIGSPEAADKMDAAKNAMGFTKPIPTTSFVKTKDANGNIVTKVTKTNESEELDEATRKDFQQMADTIKNIESPEKRQELANNTATAFAKGNPRFNHATYHAACGTKHGA